MKGNSFVLLIILFLCVGCFDIFSEEQKEIIGNISVINPNNQEDKGYKLIIYEEQINKNVIEGYVVDVNGNDTILLVKAVNKRDCYEHYYEVKHRKGQAIIKSVEIDPTKYLNLLNHIDSDIEFQAEMPDCP